MYFVDGIIIPPLVFGFVLLTFANTITDYFAKKAPLRNIVKIKTIGPLFYMFCLWAYRIVGIACIVISLHSAKYSPSGGALRSDKNKIALLENGEVAKATVIKRWYSEGAPKGWRVFYQFITPNPKTGENQMYWGISSGPKEYYFELSPGDNISVIYYPSKPKINCEIKKFLNFPSYRYTFKEAGILYQIDRFRDKCEIKDYSLIQWYDLQGEK